MQESSSSHSIPHVALSADSKAPSISYSTSHTTDMSSAQSSNTPQFKKKLLTEKSPSSSARESGSHIPKHQSFDYAKSELFTKLGELNEKKNKFQEKKNMNSIYFV